MGFFGPSTGHPLIQAVRFIKSDTIPSRIERKLRTALGCRDCQLKRTVDAMLTKRQAKKLIHKSEVAIRFLWGVGFHILCT